MSFTSSYLGFLDDEKDNEDHPLYNQTKIKNFTEY